MHSRILSVALALFAGTLYAEETPVSFNKQIRPILSDKCFACHGPDAATRKANLRFDIEKDALAALKSGGFAIVPGDITKSEVHARITATDPAVKMPPAEFNKTLSQAEIDVLALWIQQGAKYEAHWSFVAPKRLDPPVASLPAWPRNPIDNFILATLDQEGLQPSPEADKRQLIRRVSFDLTGLPPTPAEVETFLADASPDAYEKLVDRLLASPHYGEHMARYWLDISRYADTNGYHIDNERYMWRWRDWVIKAFNDNKPYDAFTTEQIAGDLIPDASLEQKIATGFNRNHMITFEGGIIPEEYRVQYVIDRVNTTSSVWLGLTVGCAQCHDHKFDPISQKEFFEFSAFFANIPEEGSDGRLGNAAPSIAAPLPEQAEKLAALTAEIDMAKAGMSAPHAELDEAQAKWEADAIASLGQRWTTVKPATQTAQGGTTLKLLEDGSLLAEGENPVTQVYELTATLSDLNISALRLEAIADPSLSKGTPARSENGNFVLTEFEMEVAPADKPDQLKPVAFRYANADHSQPTFDVTSAIDGNKDTGWGSEGFDHPDSRTAIFVPREPLGFDGGTLVKIRIRHESKFAQHSIGRFRLATTKDAAMGGSALSPWFASGPYTAANGQEAHAKAFPPEETPGAVDLKAVYEDGRLKWAEVKPGYADGVTHTLAGDVASTYLYRTINAPSARTFEFSIASNDAAKVWVNGQLLADTKDRPAGEEQGRLTVPLKAGENALLLKVTNYGNVYNFAFTPRNEQVGEVPLEIERILSASARGEAETNKLRTFYRNKFSPEYQTQSTKLAALEQEKIEFEKQVPTVMVMAELETPRKTFMLERGQYDLPKDEVFAATPAALPAFAGDSPKNRLGFSKWLLDPANPLTSRVAVNRFWLQYFGTGIVKTAEDFGLQGEQPTHPELLDWLATEFIRTGWDIKGLQRLIVTSATYRQSAKQTPELTAKDPENRLLARAPRFRLDAEVVRDNALAASGLLVPTIGGPSVKPYQPKGLWEEVSYGGTEFTGQVFEQDHGEKLYRRSMYIFWKRQSPPPSMMILDAPNREVCTIRRPRTNTPLQALQQMNDPQFVEAARHLAHRMLTDGGADSATRIAHGFELATGREPNAAEKEVLLGVLQQQQAEYEANQEAALQLLTVGESPRDEALAVPEFAAWTTIASMILNLDETITKS